MAYSTTYTSCRHILMENPKGFMYALLLLSCLTVLIAKALTRRKQVPNRRQTSPDPEKPASKRSSTFKAPEREPGVWTPLDFKRPKASPNPGWNVHESKPLPYRPFKHGPYHITMGLRSMQWDEWIELDDQYPKFHELKKQRILDRGDKCCKTAPEGYDGAVELLEEL